MSATRADWRSATGGIHKMVASTGGEIRNNPSPLHTYIEVQAAIWKRFDFHSFITTWRLLCLGYFGIFGIDL